MTVSTIDGVSLIKIAVHSFEKSRQIESAVSPSRNWTPRKFINGVGDIYTPLQWHSIKRILARRRKRARDRMNGPTTVTRGYKPKILRKWHCNSITPLVVSDVNELHLAYSCVYG